MSEKSEGATIHILRHGFAICGTVQGIPRDWPEGNAWVDMFAFESANCVPCLRRLCSELQSLIVGQEGGW
jgi:hypothetical protein